MELEQTPGSETHEQGTEGTDNTPEDRAMDRLDFLRTSAAAGTGLMLTPLALGQVGAMDSDDLNVAIIGCGAQGQVLVDAMLKIPGLRFKAVCDIWEAYNLRRVVNLLTAYDHELNTYVDYQEMLDSETDLDAVIIATPDFWHADQAVACLEAGINVYCEKEMSNTLEGARRIVLAARQTGKLLQIGHQRRSNPRYLHCYSLIQDTQLLGQITTVNGQWNRSVQPDNRWPQNAPIDQATLEKYGYESMAQFRNWRWYRGLGGGPIVDLGSHQLDIYNWFLDARPARVMATGSRGYYSDDTHEWFDTVMTILDYQTNEGLVKAFYQTISTNSSQGYFETFMGDKGTMLITESGSRSGVYREPAADDWLPLVEAGYLTEPMAEVQEDPAQASAVLDVRETLAPAKYELNVEFNDLYHKPHLENFFDSIRGRASLNCPHDLGYETAVTVLKINEAIAAGGLLEYNPGDFEV